MRKAEIGIAARVVLKRLAEGGWVLDRFGRNENRGIMVRARDERFIIAARTMDMLLSEGLISPSTGEVSDYKITKVGMEYV